MYDLISLPTKRRNNKTDVNTHNLLSTPFSPHHRHRHDQYQCVRIGIRLYIVLAIPPDSVDFTLDSVSILLPSVWYHQHQHRQEVSFIHIVTASLIFSTFICVIICFTPFTFITACYVQEAQMYIAISLWLPWTVFTRDFVVDLEMKDDVCKRRKDELFVK